MTTEALAPRLTIAELVRVYEQTAETVRRTFAELHAAEQRLRTVSNGVRITGWSRDLNLEDPERTLRDVRRDVWRGLVERLELRRFLSVRAWEELQGQIERYEMPDITLETVTAVTRGFESRVPEMLEDAVAEVFEMLRPHASRYKTNTELEVGERVILPYCVERWDCGAHHWRVCYHYAPRLSALERVFQALDGQGLVAKTHRSELVDAIEAAGEDGRGETRYFAFRACRNRSLHLRILRSDLLCRFNAIAGGRRLRPAAAE